MWHLYTLGISWICELLNYSIRIQIQLNLRTWKFKFQIAMLHLYEVAMLQFWIEKQMSVCSFVSSALLFAAVFKSSYTFWSWFLVQFFLQVFCWLYCFNSGIHPYSFLEISLFFMFIFYRYLRSRVNWSHGYRQNQWIGTMDSQLCNSIVSTYYNYLKIF